MNAGALVYCLLDAEGDYTPEGYQLLDTAHVGDYELKLWQGQAHIKGQPIKFNEVSLNAVGRRFDPESQKQKFPGSTHALGHRSELLRTVANWIRQHGDLYIGSYIPSKLRVYHRMFRRYLQRLSVSEPYAPFDECNGEPEYFLVQGQPGVLESILEAAEADVDVRRYIDELPSVVDRATTEATKIFAEQVDKGLVNDENFPEMAEAAVDEVVNNLRLTSGDEVVDIDTFNTVLRNVLAYADQRWPGTQDQ